ncbi:MAG: hydrogenase expression/formation protein [Planctomycetes bacterium]|nr:hydrogenase expression/formation protein [Planctomycetota bacterium]
MRKFPVGKLPPDLLEKLLKSYPITDPRIVIGPKIGEDATVIDFGERYLVAKTDPVTFATQEIGWYAVNVNANDIATMGATPKWFLASVLLPEGKTDEALVKGIFQDITRAVDELGVTLCGGHTEITYGLDRPIVVGHMLGEVEKEKLVVSTNVEVGDDIILTKGIAIEGTALIALERGEELSRDYGWEFVKQAQRLLHDPGISVVKEALLANSVAKVHAMHDPTEGGLATGLWEIAKLVDKGLTVNLDAVYCLKETRMVCEKYNLEPLGLIASGSLLVVCKPSDSARVLDILRKNNINCEIIGSITTPHPTLPPEGGGRESGGIKAIKKGKVVSLPLFKVDEITKVL